MKTKIFFVIAFTLFVQIVTAQTFGIKGGVNFANVTFSGDGMNFSPKSITSFHVGPVADFVMHESLHFNTGLLFSVKGFKMVMDFFETTTDVTEKVNYLEIPLNLAYKFSVGETSNFFVQAGPYLGYALNGKAKGGGETSDVEFGSGKMKRLDFGVGFGAGLEFGSIVTSLNYQLGLANLVDDQTAKMKNKVLQISVAYMFGNK